MDKLNDDYPYWRSRWRCGCIRKAAGSLIRTAPKKTGHSGDGNSTNCMVVDQSPRLLGGPCSASRPCRKESLEPFVDKLCPKWKTPVGDGQKKCNWYCNTWRKEERKRKRNPRLHTQQKKCWTSMIDVIRKKRAGTSAPMSVDMWVSKTMARDVEWSYRRRGWLISYQVHT